MEELVILLSLGGDGRITLKRGPTAAEVRVFARNIGFRHRVSCRGCVLLAGHVLLVDVCCCERMWRM